MRSEWDDLDRRIRASTMNLRRAPARMKMPGTWPPFQGSACFNATALVPAIGKGQGFARPRDLSAWLGRVPRTTGGKPCLKGITKRGNVYLRTLLIHGARAAMTPLSGTHTALGRWGYAACWHARMQTPSSLHSRTSWRGSPGRCCALDAASRLEKFEAREVVDVVI